MSYIDNHKRIDLPECPICGMYSGKRMVSKREPANYYVICEVCGFKTRPHPTQSAATKEWCNKKRRKNK